MIRAIISFLASVLTAVQVVLLHTGAKGLCFNEGCEIVDSMTNVSPLVFNIAGFLFFQALFWLFLCGRKGSEYWHKLARLLLLAGFAAEAVLVFFQYSIATVFCSYCLVILAVIALLNLCCGMYQFVRGMVIFIAVLVACFSLQFGPSSAARGSSLDSGSLAMVNGKRDGAKRYLFFSASCAHCEKVIESIGADNICTVRFNPIEKIEKLAVPGMVKFTDYQPEVNRSLLQSLSIGEVPVLMVKTEDETHIFKGEKRIREYLEKTCKRNRDVDYSGTSNVKTPAYTFLSEAKKSGEDACLVNTDCDTNVAPISTGQ
ncbi:MAG: vitamin K epoxide reductase family protein [Proteobacteria bacterium]|nr:vitamin K epoxide reductase family protein [Pseudomonadota bacterium]